MRSQIRNQPKHQGGFTLVELMVTVALLGILASLATTGFRSFQATNQVKNMATRIAQVMKQASVTAIVNKSPVEVNVRTFLSDPNEPAVQAWLEVVPLIINDTGGYETNEIISVTPIISLESANDIPGRNLAQEFFYARPWFADISSIGFEGVDNACHGSSNSPGTLPPICGSITFNSRGEVSKGSAIHIAVCSEDLEYEMYGVTISARGSVSSGKLSEEDLDTIAASPDNACFA